VKFRRKDGRDFRPPVLRQAITNYHAIFNFHGAIMSQTHKRQKPTVGFRANLFVIARFDGTAWSAMGCPKREREKANKREKKCHFFRPDPPFFCQNASFFGQNQPTRRSTICKLLPLRWLRCVKKGVSGSPFYFPH
jgi:hypothetical protein